MSRACSRLASFLVQAERQLSKGWAGTHLKPSHSWKSDTQISSLCSDLMVKVLLKFVEDQVGRLGWLGESA